MKPSFACRVDGFGLFFDGTEGPAYALVGARRIVLAEVRGATLVRVPEAAILQGRRATAVIALGRETDVVTEVADGDFASPVAVRLL